MTFYELNLLGEYNSDPKEILFLPILVFCQPSKFVPLATKPPYTQEAVSKCPENSNTMCTFLKVCFPCLLIEIYIASGTPCGDFF